MSRPWRGVPLRDVMAVSDRAVPVGHLSNVDLAGVYSFGRGLFRRGPIDPQETSYKSYNRLVAGEFVISQPKAWEGALALVTPEFDGWYLSPVFPTFSIDRNRLLPEYLSWSCRRSSVWFDLQQRSRGIGARRETVSPESFLSLEIPLPSVAEQRRIVERIEAIAGKIEEAKRLRGEADAEQVFSRIRRHWYEAAGQKFAKRPLGELISMASGEGLTSAVMDDSAPYPVYGGGGLNGRHTLYLFEEPKIAIGRVGARCGCVFVTQPKAWITDNALYLREISGELYEPYLAHGLASLDLRKQANQAAQPVVSQKNINPMQIPVPPLAEQRRIAAELDVLQAKIEGLVRAQEAVALEVDALLPAVLDQAFRREM